jgi:hypothetical protein
MENLLSDTQKAKLIEKYRDINVDWNDWHESEVEGFKEDMKAIGINVDRVYFSGFWSQGDGACFEGSAEFPKFMDNFSADKYPMIRKALEHGGYAKFSTRHSGHYYHENCIEYSCEVEYLYQLLDTSNEFKAQVVDVYDKQLDKEVAEFEYEALEFFKDKMREVYRRLQEQYEYYVSDEAVWETIEANDLHLDIEDEE